MKAAELRQEHIGFQANLYESSNPTRRWLHNTRRDWVMKAIDRVSPANAHYFEVGVGCGIYTHHLAQRGNVFAIDINRDFVAAANNMVHVVAKVSDITAERFEPVHDVALCSEVLEHVPDSAAALRNIFASLKPGGVLVLTTPNSFSTVELTARLLTFGPIVKLARLIYGESVDDLGHINRMTRRRLRNQIESAGFKVISHESIAFYIPGIAEFFGGTGTRICQWFCKKLTGSPLAWLLWTQCWILQRPAE